MPKLMAIILTYNEAKHIQGCLQTLQFADDRLVFDSYSTDDTVALAQAAGAQVLQHKFDDYASQRNAALTAVSDQCDWVLFIDADERVTPALAKEVRQIIDQSEHVAWGIPRHNYLFRKLTLGAGWYPDYQMRLLRMGRVHYDTSR
ncbi:MAG: glycosyltransferase family 2 protein [Anaerolineae bacterium]|nr:glycosyltransferase family 2 protein [Anaerolineae bacterium]